MTHRPHPAICHWYRQRCHPVEDLPDEALVFLLPCPAGDLITLAC
jgi:hypothetical protein